MVTDAILQFFLAIANGIWGILPAWNVTPDDDAIAGLQTYINGLNGWLPVQEVSQLIGLYATVYAAILAFKAGMKVLSLIRGGG
jgi:hypothetical protein